MGSYRILLILFAFILACGGEETPRDSHNTSDNEGTSPSSDTGTDSDSHTEEGDGTGEEGTGDNQDQNTDDETDEDKKEELLGIAKEIMENNLGSFDWDW